MSCTTNTFTGKVLSKDNSISFHHLFQHELSCVAVAKNRRKAGIWLALEVFPRVHNASAICIGENGTARLHDFYPFGLRAQNDAWFLEEIGFLLHAARVGHHESGITFQFYHLDK